MKQMAYWLCLLALALPRAWAQENGAEVSAQSVPEPSAEAPPADNVAPTQTEEAPPPAAPEPALPVIALPAEPAPPLQAPADEAVELDEVVVTAQKREQRLVDVPLNVSSLSREDVEKTRIEQVRDLSAYVPSLDIKEQVPGAIPVVSIRGIGLDDFSSTNSPAAGIYVDQVTLSSLALMSFDLYDLERIEVLKGPQGTLYGRNSTAGAINVLSAKPQYEPAAYLKGGMGNYQTKNLEGMVNVPLGENFALRLAAKLLRQDEGFWKSRLNADDPYDGSMTPAGGLPALFGVPPPRQRDTSTDPVKRDIGRRDIQLARARLAWDVGAGLQADLKIEGLRQRSELGQPEQFGSYCEEGFSAIDQAHCTDSVGYSDTDGDPYQGDWRGNFPYTIDQRSETLTLDWELEGMTLSSVSGHIKLDRFFHIDVDGGPEDAFDFFQRDTVDQLTQELRLAGSAEAAEWLLGAFYSEDDIGVHTDGLHQDAIPDEVSLILVDQRTRSGALFGSVDWKLREGLSLTTGLRYTSESRHYTGGSTWTVEIPDNIETTYTDTGIADKNWSWKLGLNWAPDGRSLLYANAARGVKSGGFFSGVTTEQSQLDPYKPEQLTAYEIGYKRSGALSLNTSVFFYDYVDVQTFKRSNTAPVQFIGNVDQARNYGLDAELAWRGFEGLTLQAGLGLLRTRLGEFIGPTGDPVPAGNRLANAPETTANLLVRYEWPLLSGARVLAVQADAHYSGDTFKEATNDPLIHSEAYTTCNARLALLTAERSWELALWGRNLSDARYVVQGLDIGAFFFGNRNYNAPRTVGVEFSYHF